MTYQEAEKLIDETFRAGEITVIKIIAISLIGAVILALIENPLENIWENIKYWIDCKKWDWEHRKEK